MTVTPQPLNRRDSARKSAGTLALFVLIFALTWIVWVPRALVSQGIIHIDIPVMLGRAWTYMPALAAFLFVALTAGRGGVADLRRRLLDWRFGWRWYALIGAVPIGIALGTATIYSIRGGDFGAALPLSFALPLPLIPLILAIRVLTDGVGEETAWRGVALPRLLEQMNAATASLVLGLVWAAWHLPLIFTSGAVMADASIVMLFALLPAQAVFYTWLYQRTAGSVLAAALLHGWIGLLSLGSESAEATGDPDRIRLALWWIVAGFLIVRYGPSLDRSPRPRAQRGLTLDDGPSENPDASAMSDPPTPGSE